MVAARNLSGLDVRGLTSDSREVKPGYLFAALPGSKTDGARFLKDAVAGARAVLGRPELADDAKALGVRLHRRRKSAARAGAHGRRVLRRAARDRRRRHRHQRQNLRRRVPAPDLDAAGQQAASLGTVGVVTPKGEIALDTHHARSGGNPRLLAQLKQDGVDHLALEASSHGLDQYRLDGVKIVGGGLHQHHPRSSGLSRAPSRITSPPSCGCSPKWWRRAASRVVNRRRRTCRCLHRRREEARASPCSPWAKRAKR